MNDQNNSAVILKTGESTEIQQNQSEFYKLHYRPKKSVQDSKNSIGFRARSVNTIIQAKNPQEHPNDLYIKHKRSLKERIKEHQKQKQKIKPQKKVEKFSFKQVLSKKIKCQQVQQELSKFGDKLNVDLEQYGRKNMAVKLAIQRCKDQKMKIKKVISSTKQSQQTKIDYLQLKKKDIEQQIKKEIAIIYQQFFKKEYEHEMRGFSQFQQKIRVAMQYMHEQMFGSK